MPSKKPVITIRVNPEEYESLKGWADSEFRSVPSLVLAIVRKTLLESKDQHLLSRSPLKIPQPQPPTASKTNGKGRGKSKQPQTTKPEASP